MGQQLFLYPLIERLPLLEPPVADGAIRRLMVGFLPEVAEGSDPFDWPDSCFRPEELSEVFMRPFEQWRLDQVVRRVSRFDGAQALVEGLRSLSGPSFLLVPTVDGGRDVDSSSTTLEFSQITGVLGARLGAPACIWSADFHRVDWSRLSFGREAQGAFHDDATLERALKGGLAAFFHPWPSRPSAWFVRHSF